MERRFLGQDQQVNALDKVSFDVEAGEFLVLVGPSGCGKSTLLNIIAGLEKADFGEVLIDGKPVTKPGPDRALVFQDGALFPWLNVRKNVEFGLRQKGVPKGQASERAMYFLDQVGLAKFAENDLYTLSGGMKQRVAIARVLALEPEVLLMDEPFSALDAITREDLYAEVQHLWQGRGATIVFVTHNVREAVTLGDRVLLMASDPGRVQWELPLNILRPRHIDDVDVARVARQLAQAMRRGRETYTKEGWSHDEFEEIDILRDLDSALGDRSG
ncbi:MAG: ABC transporter ATP-binding protein [Fimbriimonas sp.]|nr:ABC transporter ATP-binding protein [Fimbriimonas sp.]